MLLYSYHSIISRSNLIHHCVKESLDAGWPNAGEQILYGDMSPMNGIYKNYGLSSWKAMGENPCYQVQVPN
jgi:hypothetical protein